MQVNALSRFDDLNQELLGSLNPEQYEAVTTLNKALLVLSGAGTGKTKVLSDRVLRLLLNDCNPSRILCLTYTKAAAVEMSNRINSIR